MLNTSSESCCAALNVSWQEHCSSVRRQKGLTGYCFKYTDRPFCLRADVLIISDCELIRIDQFVHLYHEHANIGLEYSINNGFLLLSLAFWIGNGDITVMISQYTYRHSTFLLSFISVEPPKNYIIWESCISMTTVKCYMQTVYVFLCHVVLQA